MSRITNKNTLFISYDGLLDQLGSSQILPYVRHINHDVKKMHIISFEKRSKYNCEGETLHKILEKEKIHWHPLYFTNRFGSISKFYDLIKMQLMSFLISWKYKIAITHCRGHVSAISGLFLKFIFRVKYIFDFRGLWVDERVDKGSWNLSKMSHKLQFSVFKHIERLSLIKSDHVVVLTNKACNEIEEKFNIIKSKISVIPCCADYSHFNVATPAQKLQSKSDLEIPNNSKVIGYLGSIGKMYMIAEMLKFFKICCNEDKNTHLIVITQDLLEFKKILYLELSENYHAHIHIISANRDQVPKLLCVIDLMVLFCQPGYSRIAASPTKLGESFASGIPVIANDGIGDVSQNVKTVNGGIIISDTNDHNLIDASKIFFNGNFSKGKELREKSEELFSLEIARYKYSNIYKDFF